MESKPCFVYFLCLIIISLSTNFPEVVDGARRHKHAPTKLFVFGDSYVDTGNWPRRDCSSWKDPYGITFPGEPTGRFSDGRVLTDYIASYLGIRSPLPYRWREFGGKIVGDGMNFAYGGTGVFSTLVSKPNMTTQINFFQQMVEENVYTKRDLRSSIALVSVAGNDYATVAKNGNIQDIEAFTEKIIQQLTLDLRRLHGLGVGKVGVTAIEPLGCLPQFTASTSYQNCSEVENSLSRFHNQMLKQSIDKLNNETAAGQPFVVLDLYTAFMSALNIHENHPGISSFENPLTPCCVGKSNQFGCGGVDKNGRKDYVLCDDAKQSFFWDVIHPSQQGWFSVHLALKSSLHKLIV
ncbi:PREDICTED: GDSL esterase/lipase At5g03610-like [Ipomoea nil]|uniref:GDSL esterase/lipase At5g03610-like n=1 Tax=Ipomoea nil TaxID=35883 RepID=UPI000901050B|nr:PREDICTED: GDSL esterase/lipase At5g03610-like [Ipomoea nil]